MNNFKVRLVLYPAQWFVSFIFAVLLGSFVTAEIDPMQWSQSARGSLIAGWGFGQFFMTMAIEFSELPQKITKSLEPPQ